MQMNAEWMLNEYWIYSYRLSFISHRLKESLQLSNKKPNNPVKMSKMFMYTLHKKATQKCIQLPKPSEKW